MTTPDNASDAYKNQIRDIVLGNNTITVRTASELSAAVAAAAVDSSSSNPYKIIVSAGLMEITDTLLLPSFTTLDLTGVTLRLVGGTANNLIMNENATRSVTSITFVGTLATVTMTAHDYVTGQPVDITGANDVIAGDAVLYNGDHYITKVDDDTFTYVMTGTPGGNAAGTLLCQGDRDIAVIGGTVDFNYRVNVGGGDGYKYQTMVMINTFNVSVEGVSFHDSRKFNLYFYNSAAANIENIRFSKHDSSTNGDGLHITGPAKDFKVNGVFGDTTDDFCALTPQEWDTFARNEGGDIENITYSNLHPRTGGIAGLKIAGDTGFKVRGIVVENSIGVTGSVFIFITNDGTFLEATYVEDLTIKNCGLQPDFDNHFISVSAAAGKVSTVEKLYIDNCNVSFATGGVHGSRSFVYVDPESTIDQLIINNCNISSTGHLSTARTINQDGAINRITINGTTIKDASNLHDVTANANAAIQILMTNVILDNVRWGIEAITGQTVTASMACVKMINTDAAASVKKLCNDSTGDIVLRGEATVDTNATIGAVTGGGSSVDGNFDVI